MNFSCPYFPSIWHLVGFAILVLSSYILGSIPFGYIIARIRGIDIQKEGSGNIGATNVSRVLGIKYGIIVFMLDILKGLIPTLIAIKLFSYELSVLVGMSAILGHMYPLFLEKGGKGVATSFGVFVVIEPIYTLIALGVFLVVVLISRIVSIASLSAILVFLGIYLYKTVKIGGTYWKVFFVIVILVGLIFWKHLPNIKRLLKGEEHRW